MGSNARAGLKQLSEGFERKKFRGKMRGVRLDKWWPVASGIVAPPMKFIVQPPWWETIFGGKMLYTSSYSVCT